MTRFRYILLILSLLLLPLSQAAQVIEEGTIQEARFLIAIPEQWNGKLLLIGHGYVPLTQPLSADFSPEKKVYQDLLEDGWMVASTSYRRNGMIIKEAIKDLDQLYSHIVKTYGRPTMTLVQGSSMGGIIGTLIAENPRRRYQGVLNMGAALHVSDSSQLFKLNNKPKIPLLFLSNQSEYEAPKKYLDLSKEGAVVLWKISRNGHVNINQEEQAQALQALEKMVEGKTVPLLKDGTVNMDPGSTAEFRKEGAFSRIAWVDPVYGNLYTEFVPEDFWRLKIKKGEQFKISYNGQSHQVLYGTTYNDVPEGQWVAFLSGEGSFQISCNYCNAGKMLDYRKGDRIFIHK